MNMGMARSNHWRGARGHWRGCTRTSRGPAGAPAHRPRRRGIMLRKLAVDAPGDQQQHGLDQPEVGRLSAHRSWAGAALDER